MSLLDDLQWRYATKKMNGQRVPQDQLNYILEAARLAPSSSGLQPYKIFVISDREKLDQIREFAFNQSQITDCSHLLVWAAWDRYSENRIGEILVKTSRERGLPDTTSEDYTKMLWGMYETLPEDWHANHSAKQAYISFGLAIAAAAEQKVDATPMEGFDKEKMDAFLGLDQQGLKSVVILPIGYREPENDWLVNLKKYRMPQDEFIIEIA
jgi:nitroreductase/dihydropteridine reductase